MAILLPGLQGCLAEPAESVVIQSRRASWLLNYGLH